VKACKTIGDDGPASPGHYASINDDRFDAYHCHGQKVMFWYLQRNEVKQEHLFEMLLSKSKIVDSYRQVGKEDKVTGKEIKERMIAEFNRIISA
jgi:hypothetical protein